MVYKADIIRIIWTKDGSEQVVKQKSITEIVQMLSLHLPHLTLHDFRLL